MLQRLLQCVTDTFLPRPKVRQNARKNPQRPVKNVIVFGRHPNPTTDYYFTARFADRVDIGYQLADIRAKSFDDLKAEGALVILCRYASATVVRWIIKNKSKLAGVVLFLDDDIPAIIMGRDATFSYRVFLYYRALFPLKKLNQHLDAVWVSTQRLGESLGGVKFEVVPPAPASNLWDVNRTKQPTSNEILIAYHATSIHYREHIFLQPIVAEILQKRPNTRFEVFADRRAAKIWNTVERVTVRSPTSWADYLAESVTRSIDIMLVPLCYSNVNACRSPTKRIDVARFGAAGIFSLSEAYGTCQEGDEILLPNDSTLWIDAILNLTDDIKLRENAAQATLFNVQKMAAGPHKWFDMN